MFDYDKESRDAAATLDKDDLSEQLKWCLERDYTELCDIRGCFMESYKFNNEMYAAIEALTLDEFMEYLTTRYGAYWSDEITYYMHFKDNVVTRREELGTKG